MGIFSNQYRIIERTTFNGDKSFIIQSRHWDCLWWSEWEDEYVKFHKCEYNTLEKAEEGILFVLPKPPSMDIEIRRY